MNKRYWFKVWWWKGRYATFLLSIARWFTARADAIAKSM